jgi:hypothetical protein
MAFSLAVIAFIATSELVRPPSAEEVVALDHVRIYTHLTDVERELRARDVSDLPLTAQAARGRALDRLKEYREAGVYPRNHGHPAERVPYFVDSDGRACAMAHLIRESGAVALAAKIAAHENNARIDRMRTHLAGWLLDNGLTAAEAQRIQPTYEYACRCSSLERPVCVLQAGPDGPQEVTYVNRCAALECSGLTASDILYEGACSNAAPGQAPSHGDAADCVCELEAGDGSCECRMPPATETNSLSAAFGAGAILLGAVLRRFLRKGDHK